MKLRTLSDASRRFGRLKCEVGCAHCGTECESGSRISRNLGVTAYAPGRLRHGERVTTRRCGLRVAGRELTAGGDTSSSPIFDDLAQDRHRSDE